MTSFSIILGRFIIECDFDHTMNILKYLDKEEEKLLKTMTYEAGETIFRENDECFAIGIVLKGSVKIVSYSHLGNEIVFNTVNENGIFGNNLLFSSSPYYKGDVETLGDTVIAYLHKNDLLSIFKHNESFLKAYLEIQADFGKSLNSKIKLLSLSSARERLLYLLEDNDGTVDYESVTSLAGELNLERETLSRTISALVKEGQIIKGSHVLRLKDRLS